MKKKVFLSLSVLVGLGIVAATSQDASAATATKELYRLYNHNSGEHFYTLDAGEKNGLVKAGWTDEGIGWYTPEKGDQVYRLYNPNAGDHHYTESKGEYDNLVKLGWTGEGKSFNSATKDQPRVPIYRAYNPNAKAGAHNFTASLTEQEGLVKVGWTDEKIGFYGVDKNFVDKSELNALIEKNKDITADDYTAKSYQAYQDALATAQTVAKNTAATQAEVDGATKGLNDAVNNLTTLKELNATLATLGKLDMKNNAQQIYSAKQWEEFIGGPLFNHIMKDIVSNPDVTQKQVDEAIKNIQEAYDNVLFNGNLVALQAVNYDASDFESADKQKDYTDNLLPALKAMIAETDNGDKTQAEIEQYAKDFVEKAKADLTTAGQVKLPSLSAKPNLTDPVE